MKKTKFSLVYAKDLSISPGGSTGNNEMVEFSSMWGALKYVLTTRAAQRAIFADRYYWIRVVPKKSGSAA